MVNHRADLLIWKTDLNLWTDSPIGLNFPFIYKAFQESCRCFSAQHDSIELIPSPNFGECLSNHHFVKTKRNPQDEWVPSRVRILFPTDTGGCFWNHRGSPIWSSYHVCFVHVGQQKKNRRGKKTSVSLNKNQITCFNPQIVTAKFKYRIGLGFIGTRTKLGTTTQTTVVIYQVTDVYRMAKGEMCQGCTMAEGTTFDAHVWWKSQGTKGRTVVTGHFWDHHQVGKIEIFQTLAIFEGFFSQLL